MFGNKEKSSRSGHLKRDMKYVENPNWTSESPASHPSQNSRSQNEESPAVGSYSSWIDPETMRSPNTKRFSAPNRVINLKPQTFNEEADPDERVTRRARAAEHVEKKKLKAAALEDSVSSLRKNHKIIFATGVGQSSDEFFQNPNPKVPLDDSNGRAPKRRPSDSGRPKRANPEVRSKLKNNDRPVCGCNEKAFSTNSLTVEPQQTLSFIWCNSCQLRVLPKYNYCGDCGNPLKRDLCRKCGKWIAPTPPNEELNGDWACTNCDMMNLDSSEACFKCRVAKPGDWVCKICDASNLQRESETCFKCGEPISGSWMCAYCDQPNLQSSEACCKCRELRPGIKNEI
jgi:hypothetical protein